MAYIQIFLYSAYRGAYRKIYC